MRAARCLSLVGAATVIALAPDTLCAQTPLRILAGFPPGGGVDILARVFADSLSGSLGRPVVVENRAGAGGQIAAEALKAAPPDGSVLLVAPDANITVYPHTVRRPAFDARTDFAPVAHLGSYDIALGISRSVPAHSLQEFVAWAKQHPDSASYGTAGAGSTLHFLGLMFAQAAGVPLTHVPYKGVAPAVTDVAAGQIPAVMLPLGTLMPQVKAGKVLILAQSGGQRSALAPDVPTFKELGYPSLQVTGWFGMFAPAGTRPELVAQYNRIVNQGMRTPVVRERMHSLDLEIREMTPADFLSMIDLEYDRWGTIIRAAGFSADSQ